MTDSIVIQQIIQETVSAETQKQPDLKVPDQEMINRFENSMQDQGNISNTSSIEPSVEEVNNVSEPGTDPEQFTNPGDSILQGLEKLKNTYDNRIEKVDNMVKATNERSLTMQDAMQLQFEIMQINMTQDITTKVADKISQGTQTLFRNQG
ncbi:MAG: type III secretion system inner rod subunit SctI [Desulfobacterales bacterium]|nr:type III secretion system inner rod subunit SctI [Desulfobacterales bacterium]